jgi:hypothetical protein
MANAVESKLNLMAGTVRSLDQEVGTAEDKAIFDRDFDLLVKDLKNLVDPDLGGDLANEKDFYASTFQVAKGYFNKKPFGGLKATTGQFGMRLITPQDLRQAAGTETPAYYSWHQTLTTDSGDTDTKGLAYSSSYAYTQNLANKNEVLAFHRLLSYAPAPRILYLEFYVNGVGYMPYSVEPFSKIGKPDKLFKILPMPGRILLHPGGHFYCIFWLDLFGGTTAPSGTASVEVEIAPFGITFAEYDFLASSNIT